MRKILQIGLSHGSELTIRLPEPMSAVTTNGVHLTCPAYKAREAERREELALEEEKRQQEAADKKFAQERTTEALLAAGREDLLKLQTKERMQAYLKGKNMAISGKKEDLISRITKALHAPIPLPPPPPPAAPTDGGHGGDVDMLDADTGARVETSAPKPQKGQGKKRKPPHGSNFASCASISRN